MTINKFLIILIIILNNVGISIAATSVNQDDFTWTWAEDRQTGQFANGDWWVIGPITMVSILPAFMIENGLYKHGTMLNPGPLDQKTGEVNVTGYGSADYHTYSPSLNIADDLPLSVLPGTSIVSAQSYTVADPKPLNCNTSFKYFNVLTVLATAPPTGSFRPAFSTSDKTIKYNISDIDYTKMKKLPAVTKMPSITTEANLARRCWLDHTPGHLAQRINPSGSMNEYGASRHDTINHWILRLQVAATNEEKFPLLVGVLQGAIDLFGVVTELRSTWAPDGGHGGGRKLPIIFAGLVLGDLDMLNIGYKTGSYLYENGYGPGNIPPDFICFGDDMQVHYVSQLDVDITNGTHPTIPWTPSGYALDSSIWSTYDHGNPYTVDDIGMPEYGIRHGTSPGWNSKQWDTYKSYRDIPDRPMPITSLIVRILGIEEEWNNDAYLDYADRRVLVTGTKHGWSTPVEFQIAMWDTYRSQYGPMWTSTQPVIPVTPYRRLFRNVRLQEVQP